MEKKGQLPEYLRCIGKHIFGSESYFDEKKVFSLDKLREIQTADHNFASVDGIEDVKLVELQYDWGGEIEIRKSGNLLGTLIRKNGLESTSKANIIYAKFSVRFEGSNTPRKVGIRSGNQATFGRDEDSLIIEDWINDQQLIIPKIQDKRHHNMWKTLAKLPRHKHNHAFLVRHFGQKEIIKSLFDSTTVLDDNLHCENGCCCGRRICEMPNGKLLAVCNDDSSNCPDLGISDNDRRIFSLNLKKIAALIAELAQNISIFKDVQTIDGTSSCIRVGHYIPRGTIRYPVFFGVDIHDGDLEGIINHVIGLDGSAILLMPSIDNISQSKINAIRAKSSSLISLQDLTNTDTRIDTAKALEAFSAFREDQEDPMPEVSCVLFPTLADSEWSNITIKFTDGHTVRVTCNTGNNRVSQVYNFTQMGMADGRTASPNKQWNLLEGFAEERGQFTWDNPKAKGNQKKQKQELKKVFQKFFGIYDSDPFEDYKDHKNRVCYRSKFHISPDE